MRKRTPAVDRRTQARGLEAAMESYYAGQRAYWDEIARLVPLRTTVHWLHGGHPQVGTVLGFGKDGVRVRNARTNNLVWVSAYAILEAAKQDGVLQ